MKTVGATGLGGLWVLEWAWRIVEINLRCPRTSRICMSNHNILGVIVGEISAILRMDRQNDGRTWQDRLASNPD